MGQFDRLRNTALRLITKYGEKIRYFNVKNGVAVDGKDWNKTAPTEIEHSLPVVFLPKKSSFEKLFKMMQNGNVQTGNEIAYVPTLNFEPSLKDYMIRSDGSKYRIKVISPIRPNGDAVVMYEMELQE